MVAVEYGGIGQKSPGQNISIDRDGREAAGTRAIQLPKNVRWDNQGARDRRVLGESMGWFTGLFSRRRRYAEASELIREHIEERTEDLMERDGLSQEEAVRIARREFGNVTLIEERSREVWQWPTVESTWADLKFATRQLRKSPTFALTVLVTLALGIGANTAVFTLLHAVLLESLPVSDPKALYLVGDQDDCCAINGYMGHQGDFSLFSYDLYKYLQANTPEFSNLAAMQAGSTLISVRQGSSPAQAESSEFVSGNYFATFGIQPFIGRVLTDVDDTPSASPVAVMSYNAWQSDYAGDPKLVGTTIYLQERPVMVVGIAQPGFFGDRISNSPPALWIPLADEPVIRQENTILRQADESWLYLIGRIGGGVSVGSLQAKISESLRQWLITQDAYVHNMGSTQIARQHVVLTPGGAGIQSLQKQTQKGLYLLIALSGLVLFVACANIANLLLARGAARAPETAVRMALGAGPLRIMRQVFTESILLGLIGGLAGLVISYVAARTIIAMAFPNATYVPISATPSIPVLAFTLLLSLITSIAFGMAPAWLTSRGRLAGTLRGANGSPQVHSSLAPKSLVIFQVVLSLVLLGGAGLLTKSLRNLEHQNLGLQTANRYVLHLDPGSAGYTPEKLPALNRALEQQFTAIPGMESVGLALYSPMEGNDWSLRVFVAGRPPQGNADIGSSFDRVSTGFFQTMGEPIIRGRAFTDQDTATSVPVAIVNQTFVNKFFPRENPLGKHFGNWSSQPTASFEIVGVVADAKFSDPRGQVHPMFFRPLTQWRRDLVKPSWGKVEGWSLYVDSITMLFHGRPQSLGTMVRQTLANIDPNLTVISLHSFDEQVAGNFNQERLVERLAMIFGLLALTLAAIGLYGTTSYHVTQRTSEIGVRMALGANHADVLWLVLRSVFLQVGFGLMLGVPMTVLAARGIASQLYQVRPYDPFTLALAVGILVAAASIAALLPARRAAKIQPMQALRLE
jgi:predicted permease